MFTKWAESCFRFCINLVGGTRENSGTSMVSPHVAGAAAIVLALQVVIDGISVFYYAQRLWINALLPGSTHTVDMAHIYPCSPRGRVFVMWQDKACLLDTTILSLHVFFLKRTLLSRNEEQSLVVNGIFVYVGFLWACFCGNMCPNNVARRPCDSKKIYFRF